MEVHDIMALLGIRDHDIGIAVAIQLVFETRLLGCQVFEVRAL